MNHEAPLRRGFVVFSCVAVGDAGFSHYGAATIRFSGGTAIPAGSLAAK
jgi:hypothetical protein